MRAPLEEAPAYLCGGCHGDDTRPLEIGAGRYDLDGDGRAGALIEERERGLRALRARFDARLAALGMRGACDDGLRACAERLPEPMAPIARDLALLESDGSRGAHNALYMAAIFDALRARLVP